MEDIIAKAVKDKTPVDVWFTSGERHKGLTVKEVRYQPDATWVVFFGGTTKKIPEIERVMIHETLAGYIEGEIKLLAKYKTSYAESATETYQDVLKWMKNHA